MVSNGPCATLKSIQCTGMFVPLMFPQNPTMHRKNQGAQMVTMFINRMYITFLRPLFEERTEKISVKLKLKLVGTM